jgi:hypothetical protein
MVRRIVTLGVLAIGLFGGLLARPQAAHAQGLWLGGVGFGGPGFYGSGFSPYGFGTTGFYSAFAPVGFGYPVAVRRVIVASPVVPSVITPVYRARPAVQAPLNRASRRVWRRGW